VKVERPLFIKVAGATVLVVVVILGFVAAIWYRDQREALTNKFGLTLQHVAQTGALFIDGDVHEQVHTNADASAPAFVGIRNTIERIRKENELNEDQIYTMRPLGDGALEFVVMLQAKTYVGDRYVPPPRARAQFTSVLAEGKPQHTGLYTDEHGTFVSGLAPIRDHTGKVVALLEVDYNVQRFVVELRAELWHRAWVPLVAIVLALLLSLQVAHSITRAVGRLVVGTEAVQAGRYDQPVAVDTRDELRALAEAFNQMVQGLRERFAMLKFVPRHTRDIIAAAMTDADGAMVTGVAQTRDVVLFFSDIRGFTALSDRLTPEKIIRMLNIYLRKEAEIIERNGGNIDKYIGDAVMAVFEGEGRYEKAVRSAVEIQRTLAQLNADQAFEEPVQVGIGIAGGEVVMGSVGYEGRLEFAIIGRMVNLAARLCALAKGGEIVVSDVAWSLVKAQHTAEELAGVKLKGFAVDVTCYKLDGRTGG